MFTKLCEMKPLALTQQQLDEELDEGMLTQLNLSYFLDSKEFLSLCNEYYETVDGWCYMRKIRDRNKYQD